MNISAHTHTFEQEMRRQGYSENTIKTYLANVKTFFSYSDKDHPKNIHEQEIKDFLGKFTEPNTQRSYHGAIKLFYDICLGQAEKFRYIPFCKKSHKLPIILSVEEIQRMFSVCENLKHKVILAILYSTGLRVSELINLQWSHIDRSRMIINVVQGKGKKDRQVMLTPELIPLLETYYREYRSDTYVLNGQNSLKYSKESIRNVIKHLAQKSEIRKNVWTHLIRHCTFSHMVENKVDINLIQRLAGHSDVKTTSVYLHIAHNVISQIKSPLSAIIMA